MSEVTGYVCIVGGEKHMTQLGTNRAGGTKDEESSLIVDFLTTGTGFTRDKKPMFSQASVFEDKPGNKIDVVLGLELRPNTSVPIAYQVILRENEAGPDRVINIAETKCFRGTVTTDSGGDVIQHSQFSASGLGPFAPAAPAKKYTAIVPVANIDTLTTTVATVEFQVRTHRSEANSINEKCRHR